MGNILLSLCLPTNGIVEWVLPVLDSIYNQNIQESLFEVVVTDNGNNNEFEIKMNKYLIEHTNLVYKKTNAQMFHNQLEALKLASGQYLKFVNHRATMEKQSIEKMLEIIKENIHEKPVLFFANGTMRNDYSCTSFDEFVEKLGHYASWTVVSSDL